MSITKISPDVVDFDSTLTLTATDTDTVDSVSNAHLVLADDGDTAYWKVRMGNTNRYLGIDGLDGSTWKEVIAFDRTEQRVGVGTSPDYRMHIFTSDSSAGAHANADDLFIENSGNAGMTIGSGTSSNGSIFFSDSDSSLSGQLEYRHNGDSLYIYTGGGSRLRIDSDGLKFGSNTAAANALDDYEEGTWTPTYGATTASASMTGRYVKVGSLVHITMYSGAQTLSSSTGAAAQVSGLPFTAESYYTPLSISHYTSFAHDHPQPYVQTATKIVYFIESDTTTYTSWTDGSGKYLMLAGTYTTAE